MNIYSNFTHYSLKVDTSEMYQLVNGKKPVEPPWNGTLLSNAKEQITDTGNNMDESQNHNHK